MPHWEFEKTLTRAFRGRRRRLLRRRIRRGLILACVAGALGLVALAVAGVWNPLHECLRLRGTRVVVQGPGVVTAEEVCALLSVEPGTCFLELDTAGLAAELERLPRVAAARLSFGWFRKLVVEIDERPAVGMILLDDGAALEVAPDGILLPVRGAGLADLPLISWEGQVPGEAPVPGGLLDLRGAPDLMDLLQRMPHECPQLWPRISEAHLLADGTYELYWNDVPTVAWGRGRISEMRLRAWAAVMGDLRARGEADVVVDLRFREQIVVRLPSEEGTARRNAG